MVRVESDRPFPDMPEKRADWFVAFNREALKHGNCWVISSPGASEVLIEALPESSWPEELRDRGYPIKWLEEGQRVVPYATRQEMTLNADGTLAPLTPGSTQATTFVHHGAGVRRTARFTFRAPF